MKSIAYRNKLPARLLLAAVCYTLGSLSASAQDSDPIPHRQSSPGQASESWANDFPALDLTISNKKKSRLKTARGSVVLTRPFGTRGPALQLSRSLPEYARRSYRMADINGTTRIERTDAYLFLEKRW